MLFSAIWRPRTAPGFRWELPGNQTQYPLQSFLDLLTSWLKSVPAETGRAGAPPVKLTQSEPLRDDRFALH